MSSTNSLYAHVPVETFDVIDGPGVNRWSVIQNRLQAGEAFVEITLSLRTPASPKPFKGTLKVTEVTSISSDGTVWSIATYSDERVRCFYSARHRFGWFKKDWWNAG